MLNNFYINGLLKSTKDVEDAVSLLKNIFQFRCVQLVDTSNHPDLLAAIPEEDREVGMKRARPIYKTSTSKKALGVLWNTDNGILVFNINFINKPMTRRELLTRLSLTHDPLGMVKGRKTFMLKVRKINQELYMNSL